MTGLQPGSVFAGRYEVIRCIGTGGMGAVYEVLQRETRRRRALKVLLPVLVSDPDARARFAQEATITADIDSEQLVDVFDAGVDEGTGCPFIVLELLRGESVGDRLAGKRRFTKVEVCELLRQAARALECTHRAGIVHRDLKPDNLFLTVNSDGVLRVKILDFGIAKVLAASSKSRNTVNIGTPLYMAPEQLDGTRLDFRADLYALGHIGFELLTGESYWEHEVRTAPSTLALLTWIERGYPEPPHVRAQRLGVDVGPRFDAWFLRATARSPEHRFGSALEMVDAMAHALGVELDPLRPSFDRTSHGSLGNAAESSVGQQRMASSADIPIAASSPVAHVVPLFQSTDDTLDRTTQKFSGQNLDLATHTSEPFSGVARHRATAPGSRDGERRGIVWWVTGAALLGAISATIALLALPKATAPKPPDGESATAAATESPAANSAAVEPARAVPSASAGSASSAGAANSGDSGRVQASSSRALPSVSSRPTKPAPVPKSALCRKDPRRCR